MKRDWNLVREIMIQAALDAHAPPPRDKRDEYHHLLLKEGGLLQEHGPTNEGFHFAILALNEDGWREAMDAIDGTAPYPILKELLQRAAKSKYEQGVRELEGDDEQDSR